MIVFSLCKQLVEDNSVHHVSLCFFDKLILYSKSKCSTLKDRTIRLPYSYPVDNVILKQDVTLVPEASSTITGLKECSKLRKSVGDTSLPPLFLHHQ